MEALGDKLKTARENRNITIDQAARETYIARKFLEAMESERFDAFPGESYLLGFLRTYSEYLEFEADEIVSLYKNMKIQEQPAPIDELLEPKSPSPVSIVGIIFLGLLFVCGLIFLVPWGGSGESESMVEAPEVIEETTTEGRAIELAQEFIEQEFYNGDVVYVVEPDGRKDITVIVVHDQVGLSFGDQQRITLEAKKEEFLDLNGDGEQDLTVFYRDSMGDAVVLRFDRVLDSPTIDSNRTIVARESNTQGVGSTNQSERVRKSIVLIEGSRKKNFQYNVQFQQDGYARLQSDSNDANEGFMTAGKQIQGSAAENLKLWLTNAGATQLLINGAAVKLGNPGEILSWQVAWTSAGGGLYNLELIPMY